MSNKRYYWLKLQDNFFEKEEIKIIENMPNGKDYIIFYMKLLLKSVSTEGKLMFREIIPYTPEMLASITNTNIDTVRVAIDMFSKLSLMEIWDDGTLFMVETQNMIGSETKWAKKKRLQREKQKELPSKEDNVQAEGDNVPPLSQNCPTEIDTEIELDKELDKDIDIDIDMDSNYVEFFNNNFHLITKYELDTLKSYEDDKLQPGLITLALQKAVDKNKRSLDYVKGILNNWLKNNIKTVEEAEAREKEFK
ncbi:phage replisome organizer N-terminal domain-containing protein, partial [Clostridium tetani]